MCLFIILFCFVSFRSLVVFVVSREFFIFAYIFGFSYLLFSPLVRCIFFRLSIRHIYNMKWILMNFCLRNDATYAYRFSFRFCLSHFVRFKRIFRTPYPYMRHTMPANALRTHLNSNNWHALKCTKKKTTTTYSTPFALLLLFATAKSIPLDSAMASFSLCTPLFLVYFVV